MREFPGRGLGKFPLAKLLSVVCKELTCKEIK
jgi:hypothetical protein